MSESTSDPAEHDDLDDEAPSADASVAVAELDDPELDNDDPALPADEAIVIECHGNLNDPED